MVLMRDETSQAPNDTGVYGLTANGWLLEGQLKGRRHEQGRDAVGRRRQAIFHVSHSLVARGDGRDGWCSANEAQRWRKDHGNVHFTSTSEKSCLECVTRALMVSAVPNALQALTSPAHSTTPVELRVTCMGKAMRPSERSERRSVEHTQSGKGARAGSMLEARASSERKHITTRTKMYLGFPRVPQLVELQVQVSDGLRVLPRHR